MKNRMIRINDEIQKEVAQIIRGELQDPRIGAVVSVVRVETTKDLKHCKVFVSALGDESQHKEAFEAIQNASGYIRKLVAQRINLRATPQLTFVFDNSIERGVWLSKLIDEVNSPKENQ